MTHSRRDFDRFVDESADSLLRTAYLVVGDLAEAEDLVQESLLRVAKRWPRVRGMDHPVAYARRLLFNLALDGSGRRARRRSELSGDTDYELVDEVSARELGRVDTQAELMAALAALPPRQRAAIVLRYFVDLSEADVAATLGCSLGTVKSATSRGLARLEQTLRPTPAT